MPYLLIRARDAVLNESIPGKGFTVGHPPGRAGAGAIHMYNCDVLSQAVVWLQ